MKDLGILFIIIGVLCVIITVGYGCYIVHPMLAVFFCGLILVPIGKVMSDDDDELLY